MYTYVTYVKVALSNGTKTINYFPYCKASGHRAKIIGQVFHLTVLMQMYLYQTVPKRYSEGGGGGGGGVKPSAFRTLNSRIPPFFLGFLPLNVFRFQNIKTVLLSSFPYFSQYLSF